MSRTLNKKSLCHNVRGLAMSACEEFKCREVHNRPFEENGAREGARPATVHVVH